MNECPRCDRKAKPCRFCRNALEGHGVEYDSGCADCRARLIGKGRHFADSQSRRGPTKEYLAQLRRNTVTDELVRRWIARTQTASH